MPLFYGPVNTNIPTPIWHGITYWNCDPMGQNTNTATVNGRIYTQGFYVNQTVTVSAPGVWVGQAGTTPTSGANWLGIYNSAGTQLAAGSADTIYTSTGYRTVSVTPVTLTPGYYYGAILTNHTNPPQLLAYTSDSGKMNINSGASGMIRCGTGGTANSVSLPNSLTPANTNSLSFWVGGS